ncbi:VOC family protein [Pseudomaricurvus alkylphenolicus]|uniref:VOC family protein n=1 Tax=Pseudomaricurvus alkylphenolicus TaxID=1306991 RepID=UPI00141E8450|nr:VOC family protein [Pseudomaricurvus alkylphenolicus]NIB42421.1 VOC family protein [Pseudomaricurvus alkylphenolicus]
MSFKLSKQAVDVGLVTANPEPMLHFYREKLGLEEAPGVTMPGVTTHKFVWGESVIKIVVPDTDIKPPPVADSIDSLFQISGLRYLTLYVSSLDDAIQRCQDAGATFAAPKTEISPTVSVFVIQDPDGNFIEFKQDQTIS